MVQVASKDWNRTPNCTCEVCGKSFYKKPRDIAKNKHHTCSVDCCNVLRSEWMKGEGNHQFGLKGDKNASWKSDYKEKNYRFKRVLDHPFKDEDDYVPVYRLVADEYLTTEENSIVINGKRYLKQECVVHHKDFNKFNDSPDNLYVFKNKGMHILFHNLYGHRVNSVEEFEEYYKERYTNKILDYDWLYTAYVGFGLSINTMSKMFDLPYKSIQDQIDKFDLKKIKDNQDNEMTKKILLKLSNKEISYEDLLSIINK